MRFKGRDDGLDVLEGVARRGVSMTLGHESKVGDPMRCPWAITFGTTLTTRCDKLIGHAGSHEGNGLAEFPYQRVEWFPGDRREFATDRDDERAWEQ